MKIALIIFLFFIILISGCIKEGIIDINTLNFIITNKIYSNLPQNESIETMIIYYTPQNISFLEEWRSSHGINWQYPKKNLFLVISRIPSNKTVIDNKIYENIYYSMLDAKTGEIILQDEKQFHTRNLVYYNNTSYNIKFAYPSDWIIFESNETVFVIRKNNDVIGAAVFPYMASDLQELESGLTKLYKTYSNVESEIKEIDNRKWLFYLLEKNSLKSIASYTFCSNKTFLLRLDSEFISFADNQGTFNMILKTFNC